MFKKEGKERSVNQPTLIISNSPIKLGGQLNFSFSGFPPNAYVYVYCDGHGVDTKRADESGGCSSYFTGKDLPGSHTLKANDGFGNVATASFIVK